MLKDGDCLVDFSAGENLFITNAKTFCKDKNIQIYGAGFDINVGRNLEDLYIKSWFDVHPMDNNGVCFPLPQPDGSTLPIPARNLIIGLNPPFGHMSKEAKKFVKHAVKFKPRILALITPQDVDPNEDLDVTVYKMIHEEKN